MTENINVVIGIATSGRRAQMGQTLAQIRRQTHLPTEVIVCPAGADDFDPEHVPSGLLIRVVDGPRGLTSQRNTILDACQSADVIVFLDDDFYPAPDYLARVIELFKSDADIVIATNHPVLDGATGPGVAHEDALRALASLPSSAAISSTARNTYGGYGCNMAVRLAALRSHQVRFDENLPLYGWLEDIDFSRRMAPYGRIVKCSALRGVHLGTKRGRSSGLRIGYSQVANPIYLLRKGSMSSAYALRHVAKNVAKNVWRYIWPERWVDRRGRLRGNFLALGDLIRRRLDPRRIVHLE